MQTCLVVDESGVIRKVATRILSHFAVEVLDAADGAEALAKFRTAKPDLVLAASFLPDMGADDFVRQARAAESGSRCLILAMLVEGNLGLMTRLKRAGTDGFIYKPFNREHLVNWLAPHLTARQEAA